ncbi:MAG: ABC transporter permease subunit [Bacteroidia bacterium]
MNRIAKYVMFDILRNKFVVGYALFMVLVTLGMLSLESGSVKSVISLMNIVLLVVPLISIVFATIHFYNSYEFMELLLSQPVPRSAILYSQYIGLSGSLSLAFGLGMGIPLLIMNRGVISVYLLLAGIILTFVFVAIAMLGAVNSRDKARGIGMSLLIWFFFTAIYDGIVLLILFNFSDYPMEHYLLGMVSVNPIDLARVAILLQLDTAVLMGYTGAIFSEFFNNWQGLVYSSLLLLAWAVFPLLLAVRVFKRKDI